MKTIARGQITIALSEKGEPGNDGKDYNDHKGDWYIGQRGQGFDFEFPPAPISIDTSELKIYQNDLESEIRIKLNGNLVTNAINATSNANEWRSFTLNPAHISRTSNNIIRIEHIGSQIDDWGHIYRVMMQHSKKGDKGDQGNQGEGTINVYKSYNTTPETPSGTSRPPNGWSLTIPPSKTVIHYTIYDATELNQWHLSYDGFWQSNDIGDDQFVDMVITFNTTFDNQQIILDVETDSEESYDCLYISQVDSDEFETEYSGQSSDTYTMTIAQAGNHYIYVQYIKDSSHSEGKDCARVRLRTSVEIPVWMSVGTTVNGRLLKWSSPVKISGTDGPIGRSLFYRGEFSSSNKYYQNSQRVDVVKYNGSYYMYKGYNNYSSSWNYNYWETFGGEFESIATNLLLAENANIADWIIKDGKITSQNKISNGKPRAILDGNNGGVTFNSQISKYTYSGGTQTISQSIDISSSSGLMEVRNSDGDVAYISSLGMFANRAGVQAVPYSSGVELKAAMVALGNGNLQKSAYSSRAAICGIYATSYNSNSNPAPSWGAYINKLRALGFYMGVRQITSTTYLTATDFYVSCYNTGTCYIYLPSSPQEGQMILITRLNATSPTVYGNGKSIHTDGNTVSSKKVGEGRGDSALFIFDGQYWKYNYLVR